MPELDAAARKLELKLVYYGPAQSGKTTNLMQLHDLLAPQLKGEIMMLETQNDRTLFFDLLPLGFHTPTGWLIKVRLYTVPGQIAHDATRKAVLSRADGVVFVADSQQSQAINNGAAFETLADNAGRVGLDFARLPLVVQYNKRDLPNILSEAEIQSRWQGAPWPLILAAALHGQGVTATFAAVLDSVFVQLADTMDWQARMGLDLPAFRAGLMGDLK